MIGRKRGNVRRPEAQPRTGRRHVGFRATDLDVEHARLLETLRRRRGQTQHDFPDADEVVPGHATLTKRARGAT